MGIGIAWGLPILLQLVCLVHAIKTGRTGGWIYVIVFVPIAGSLAYLLLEVLPATASMETAPVHAVGFIDSLFPLHRIKRLEENLHFSDTINNRLLLADAYADTGRHDEVIRLIEAGLAAFPNDKDMLLKLAVSCYHKGDFRRSYELLEKLKNTRGTFDSFPAWKHYVLAAEQLADEATVRSEYKKIMERYRNAEIRYRFAQYLKSKYDIAEAVNLLEQLQKEKAFAKRDRDRESLRWIKQGEKMLEEIKAQTQRKG